MNRLASQRRSIQTITMGAIDEAWGLPRDVMATDLQQAMLPYRDHPTALVDEVARNLTAMFNPAICAMIVANLADAIERGV